MYVCVNKQMVYNVYLKPRKYLNTGLQSKIKLKRNYLTFFKLVSWQTLLQSSDRLSDTSM